MPFPFCTKHWYFSICLITLLRCWIFIISSFPVFLLPHNKHVGMYRRKAAEAADGDKLDGIKNIQV